jgi:UDP-glucuronate 4-epimerase
MAMWLFTKDMLAGRAIKVFNHGKMQRDFTYIDDIVQGVMRSLFEPRLEPYEVFNLGNHRSEKLLDMIGILARELGVEPKMELLPLQAGDVPATYADIARAERKLGFRPTTPIAAGIPKFVRWYRAYHRLG